ncbi:hypothetical protein BG46_25300 [Brucella anthropi]|uniref:hypothetical protein n=1 Tax=Brucella anthropi TaxID=529 RepID=UPI00044734DA|nr:hypothetical protein [Brucella anthropi]EXL04303.1 hypothetical protein BG46_25300 [Brucella anthropi]
MEEKAYSTYWIYSASTGVFGRLATEGNALDGLDADARTIPDKPEGEFRFDPALNKWVFSPEPEPTAEELREYMPPLERVDFRLRLKKAAITTSVINAAIAAVADEELREDYEIIWEDGQSFGRLDPFVIVVFEYAGKTPEQADSIWTGE